MKIGHRKAHGGIELSKGNYLKNYIAPSLVYTVIFFVATVLIFTIVNVAVILCQKFTKRKISLKGGDFEKKLPLELSYSYNILREKLLKESGILIMYVRGSDEFMSSITDFKNVLSQRTGCDVRYSKTINFALVLKMCKKWDVLSFFNVFEFPIK